MPKGTVIFLSSTWNDLVEHRKAVLFTLARLKKQVESMEYFGAMPGDPLEECLIKVKKSEYFIGILGTSYGSKTEDGISFTEKEYDTAYINQKNILMYLIDENNHPVLPKYVDTGDDAIKLYAFKQKVLKRHLSKNFNSPDHLASQVSIDLIKLFEDMGRNIRAAIEKDQLNQLLVDAGYSFSDSEMLLNMAPVDRFGNGLYRINDKNLETIFAAGFIAQNIKNNNYDILNNFVTFRPEVWRLLIHLLSYIDIDDDALSNMILKCNDSFQLRILISIAGELQKDKCAEAICKRLFDIKDHHKIIKDYDVLVTPFNDVIKRALSKLSNKTMSVIEKYIEIAKSQKKWSKKRILEQGLKWQSKDFHNVS
jgi:Domain of unknown function (DUF4062)